MSAGSSAFSALSFLAVDAAAFAPLVAFVALLPLLAAAGLALRLVAGVAGDEAEKASAGLARAAALAAFLLLVLLLAARVVGSLPPTHVAGDWLSAGALRVPLSFACDGRALGFATLIAFIGWVTLVFSTRYLHREAGFHRFFFALSLFLAGMLLIALAGNAVLAFVGWELCGVASWLLIGYADERPTATANALFAFIANRVGDAGFLLAIGLGFWWTGSADWPALAAGVPPQTVEARMLALGLVIAALAKSAQLPFTPWIARALEGPTPSSSVFYGALMVHAGVFLLIRNEALLVKVPDMMAGLVAIGLASALYGWLCGRVQSDVKSALVHGVVLQVGLMIAACGMGWFALAAWHLALHALWRAYQFLMAPSWLALAPSPPSPPPVVATSVPLYTAALQGFWLDRLACGLLLRPTRSLGSDMRRFDEQVIDRVIGLPPSRPGFGGHLLARLGAQLQRIEERLVFEGAGGAMGALLRRAGSAVRALEALLEEPRYLMLMVMATFVVIV